MRIVWLGHSAFLLEGSKKVLIDPFIIGNPLAPIGVDKIVADVIFVTHGHGDHLGDAVEIAKRNKAIIVCIHELSRVLSKKDVETLGMNIGGSAYTSGVYATMTPALHSSDFEDEKGEIISCGSAVGFVIEMDGVKVYHTGDTGLFLDMKLIGELYEPNVMLVPIGGFYTMGIKEAVKAVELVKPDVAIPMHYGTFPLINADPMEFKKLAEKFCKVVVLKPGESYEFQA
ncbi:MAG: metal-dependent hydrolase [Archaeoglobaceae archaeon]|nr:metal-dependent hydrolase [Archaeoglobaceae archaeon]